MAIIERGVRRRPSLASGLHAEIELDLEEGYPPVRIVFGDRLVLVEDGPAVAPDIRVQGSLPDLISLMVTPLWGGLPNPINARGRAALGMVGFRARDTNFKIGNFAQHRLHRGAIKGAVGLGAGAAHRRPLRRLSRRN